MLVWFTRIANTLESFDQERTLGQVRRQCHRLGRAGRGDERRDGVVTWEGGGGGNREGDEKGGKEGDGGGFGAGD